MDGDITVCKVVKGMLIKLGYEDEVAYDGVEAVKLYKMPKRQARNFIWLLWI